VIPKYLKHQEQSRKIIEGIQKFRERKNKVEEDREYRQKGKA
jgi:hypothetical protein